MNNILLPHSQHPLQVYKIYETSDFVICPSPYLFVLYVVSLGTPLEVLLAMVGIGVGAHQL